MKSLLFAILTFGTTAAGGSALSDAEVRADRAATTLDAVLAGDGEAATRHFNDTLKSALPAAQITGIVDALRHQVGAVGDRGSLRQGCEAGRHTAWQRIQFERAALDAKLVFDDEDRIGGLFFVPPQNETPCADTAAQSGEAPTSQAAVARDAREHDVVVGAADWPLPAILTVPEGDGPFPAVVLVHGSGPHDADETVFASKPFRDIAHGLADRGIASVRYVKRSKAHGVRMTSETPAFGIDDEVTDDAVSAMDWLAGQERIDGGRIVVVGHSLGALLAPRICQRSRACAGVIMLASPTRPLEELVLDQVRYLAPHQGISAEQIHSVEKQVADIARLRNGEVVEGPLMLGLSADYWRSITLYDAVATARAVDRPIMVLQGERDYQVTMADFAGWRNALAGRRNTQLKSYPALDHLFMSGTGASLPDDYRQPRHVEMQVIDDMSVWMGALRADREERAR